MSTPRWDDTSLVSCAEDTLYRYAKIRIVTSYGNVDVASLVSDIIFISIKMFSGRQSITPDKHNQLHNCDPVKVG
jgi:hypothetical protein